jgi:streptogramin lyase
MRARSILVLLATASVAACSGDGGGNGASPATTSSGAAASTSSAPPSSVALAEPKLPAIQTVAKVGGIAIDVTPEADWTLVAHGRAWASGLGKGVGEGAVWAIIDGSDCRHCAVARIDAETLQVTNRYPVPGDATAVRAGLGGVWITYAQSDSVVRLDPSTGKTVATIPVASGPRFFDVGAGAVWVMAQSAGTLCRIDPAGNRLTGCTVIDKEDVEGGDLTVGNGFVWFRGTDALVAQVDPKSGRVVRRIGNGEGSGSAGAGSGQLWISAHDVAKLYRVPVR